MANVDIIYAILNYQNENKMSREAVHASMFLSGYRFLRPNFNSDLDFEGCLNHRKIKRYNNAFDAVKDKGLEDTASLQQTLDYFIKRYSDGIETIFPVEGVFSFVNIKRILSGDKVSVDVYDKILNLLLDYEDEYTAK